MLWSGSEPACNMEACSEHSCKTQHICKGQKLTLSPQIVLYWVNWVIPCKEKGICIDCQQGERTFYRHHGLLNQISGSHFILYHLKAWPTYAGRHRGFTAAWWNTHTESIHAMQLMCPLTTHIKWAIFAQATGKCGRVCLGGGREEGWTRRADTTHTASLNTDRSRSAPEFLSAWFSF